MSERGALLMLLLLAVAAVASEAYQVNRNNGVEDGSKLIRIVGDVIFGGIFPMHEQVRYSLYALPSSHILVHRLRCTDGKIDYRSP